MHHRNERIDADIRRIARRIARRFTPDQIILFGSHARGNAGPDSDIDLLVVMPVKGSKRQKQVEVRQAVGDQALAVEIVVSRPEEFAWRKNYIGTIEHPASREGKVLYSAG